MSGVIPTNTDDAAPPNPLAVAGTVKTRCNACGQEDYWLHEASFYSCSMCASLATIVATTGHTAAEAIARAAQEFPATKVEHAPHQPTIPGLQPVFDLAAAMDAIEQQELAASQAERAYDSAHETAKTRRKEADAANEKLRDLIRALAERRHDARYEPKEPDAEEETSDKTEGQGDLCEVRDGCVDGDEVSAVRRDGPGEHAAHVQQGAVGDEVGRGDDAEAAVRLGTEVAPTSAGPATPPVAAPDDEMPPATLKALLGRAGADISLQAVADWTPAQMEVARIWASAQIEATANAAPGQLVSIRWPAHVSAAHHAKAGTVRALKKGPARSAAAAGRKKPRVSR